jgi:hypothetical protein
VAGNGLSICQKMSVIVGISMSTNHLVLMLLQLLDTQRLTQSLSLILATL